MSERELLVSDWYAEKLEREGVDALSEAIAARFPRASRFGGNRVARGLMVARLAPRYAGVAIKRGEPGATTLLIAEAIRRRRRTLLLEFIGRPRYSIWWKRALNRLWVTLVEGPAMRRAVVAAQVLTEPERDLYARTYGFEPGRLRHVPWALCRTGAEDTPPAAERDGVLASGRAFCDWPTLISAVEGTDTKLTIVCGAADREAILALADPEQVTVLAEISRDAHDSLVRAAAIFAICLDDPGVSAGQVRLMTAVELGAPVVATRSSALDGYVDEASMTLVSPGDVPELRHALETLLTSPDHRDAMARRALDRARRRTYPDYFSSVGALVDDALGGNGDG